tara:strand:- start:79 stop:1050 length:972 start_codon:yes stop_codon:yes gene_type:complete
MFGFISKFFANWAGSLPVVGGWPSGQLPPEYDGVNSIPGSDTARVQSFQEFLAQTRKPMNEFSLTNLYSLEFSTPRMLTDNLEVGDDRMLLDYYADSVNLPSKQVTTGQIANVGSAYKYTTGSAFSQINISFKIPASHRTRAIFERWVTMMNSDAHQYTEFYEDYVSPRLRIFKLERGLGAAAMYHMYNSGLYYLRPKITLFNNFDADAYLKPLSQSHQQQYQNYRLPGVVAMWELSNVFPVNIGSTQLNNMEARVATMTVGFNFERYRFYTLPLYSHGSNFDAIAPNPGLKTLGDRYGTNEYGIMGRGQYSEYHKVTHDNRW